MTQDQLLTALAIITGVVAIFELLEFVFTKNLPWLARLIWQGWRRLRRWRRRGAPGQRCLVLNFSTHPILPAQREAIRTRLKWPSLEVIDAAVGNVVENQNFVKATLKYVEQIELTPEEWQTLPLVVVPAGYASVWSVLLAELHGRLGYFPDVVRFRPAPGDATEKYELAEVIDLRSVRNRARGKR